MPLLGGAAGDSMTREQAKMRLRSAAGAVQQPACTRNVLAVALAAGFLLGVSPRARRATGSVLAALIRRCCR
jgi:hypothetical protein